MLELPTEQLDRIVIVDFGSQYTQLIARRLRELQVFSSIINPQEFLDTDQPIDCKGLILSGSPGSVGTKISDLPHHFKESEIPILGICFGMQLMNSAMGGLIRTKNQGEYGKQNISVNNNSPLFQGLPKEQSVWMSHGDSVEELAEKYIVTARSKDGIVAGVNHKELPHFGVQFHPEVTHTEFGTKILENYIKICGCKRNWTASFAIETIKEEIKNTVKNHLVISLVSGGVDSTAATLLCLEALSPEQVIPIHIDTGLMRKNESRDVMRCFEEHGIKNIRFIDASNEFLNSLTGISDPEQKRQIIGDLFIKLLDKEMETFDDKFIDPFICQGTLYTDLIESGKGCGNNAALIKSHHNVNSPYVEKKREKGLIIEPNSHIFKDEVRKISEVLGVPHRLAWRHPFPGPGLAIRILGEVTKKKISILKEADAIYLEEIEKAGLYDDIWQAFALLLPVNTVGVMGDKRSYGQVIALRAVTSVDGMTADCYPFPYDILSKISTRIINEISEVNRVVYDVTSKPPGTIEWE